MSLFFLNINEIISNYGNHKNDTGSSSVQVVLLTYRINKLRKHISMYKKDFHGRIGLLNLIFKRRKILKYIKLNNFYKYMKLVKKLKLRN